MLILQDPEDSRPVRPKTCEAQDLCFDAQLLFDLCRYLSHTIEDENKKKKERKEPTLEPYHAYDKPN